ncbi:hypothetical protein RP20_CCG010974 [Aedes albopictus]|nr:hypothetical protein RP20_CCG010974 [Aedes albopictus]
MMTVINKRCGQLGRTNMYLQSSTTVQDKKNFLAISHHSHVLPLYLQLSASAPLGFLVKCIIT